MAKPRARDILTPAQRDSMVRDYMAGVRIQVLADRYGVSTAYPGLLARRMGAQLRNGLTECPHCGKRIR